ncbi:hypothetical protein [Sphingomonas sp. Root720]|uniref:hypothetical protein n=2 Tax=Sphingomonas TaxID=13687 RepID=UPI0006F49CF3|nr:hypothetical protein [Sphingomonas sp. Root720]KQX19271.1 hypothetical protein ASD17_12040 [Sphingomonas sp. Root1294]KQY65475.1 hypothetical protein ASD39_15240 [Sphingomonas sp. Root50]
MPASLLRPSYPTEPETAEPAQRDDAAACADHRIVVASLAVALGYATLRYNVFKHVPWADWPHYVVNKALAMAGLGLIVLSAVRLARRGATIRRLMAWAGGFVSAHVLLSLALLRPDYFDKLFAGGKLTAAAGWSLLLGAAAWAATELGARRAAQWDPASRIELLGLIALASGLHAALPSVGSWFAPSTWPGGLPPITLISFAAGLAGWLAIRWRQLAGSADQ